MSEEYSDVLKNVPDYKKYLTVDENNRNSHELAKKFPDKVEHYQLGIARNGEPMMVLKVGDGKLNALVYSFSHSNEPVGSLTTDHFSRLLAEDDDLQKKLGFTWYFIKAADVVGARQNEVWFDDPTDLINRSIHNYRTPRSEECEWGYPVEYKTYKWDRSPPESKSMMRLLYEVRFDLIHCCQDQSAGGTLQTVSDPCPELYPLYQKIINKYNLQLHQAGGSWYSGTYKKLADGIYTHGIIETFYEYICNREKLIAEGYEPVIGAYIPRGANPEDVLINGDPLFGFSKTINPDVFMHQCEVSRGLYNENDSKYYSFEESDATLADVSLSLLALTEEITDSKEGLFSNVREYLPSESIVRIENDLRGNRAIIEGGRNEAEKDPLLKRSATLGEKLSIPLETERYGLDAFGGLYRQIAFDYWRRDSYKAKLGRCLEEIKDEMNAWYKRMKNNGYEDVSIKRLVSCQIEANLLAAEYVRKKRE